MIDKINGASDQKVQAEKEIKAETKSAAGKRHEEEVMVQAKPESNIKPTMGVENENGEQAGASEPPQSILPCSCAHVTPSLSLPAEPTKNSVSSSSIFNFIAFCVGFKIGSDIFGNR